MKRQEKVMAEAMKERNIAFRAWNTHTKTWAREGEIDLYDFDNAWEAIYSLDQSDKPENIVLMQFTGLLDRNGKDVFEGDIIEQHSYGGRGEIKFDEGKFYCTRGMEWGWIDEDCEVIGNVFQNPELLNPLTL